MVNKKKSHLILSSIFLILVTMSFVSAGFFDVFKKDVGLEPVTVDITVSAGDAPLVFFVSDVNTSGASTNTVELTIGPLSTSLTTVNVEVFDQNGFNNLNDTTAQIDLTRSGEPTRSTTCARDVGASSGNYANYTCDVTMFWFDDDGTWDVNFSIADINLNRGENSTETFTITAFQGFVADPDGLTFPTLAPGAVDTLANNDPIRMNNTGNIDLTLQINATDVIGLSDNSRIIYEGNFSVGPSSGSECSATDMDDGNAADDLYVAVAGATLPRGNFSVDDGSTGQEELYFCLNFAGPELTAQSYSTLALEQWDIQFV